MFNNLYIIEHLSEDQKGPTHRSRVNSTPCLLSRLPNLAFLRREGELSAAEAIIRQIRSHPSFSETEHHEPDVDQEGGTRRRSTSVTSTNTVRSALAPAKPLQWKEPQVFEVFRAVERKDIMFLMEVRDHAFHLLLQKSGDVTPLLHAMRIGQTHRDVAILLVGALSRWVNHLEDEEMQKPKTKTLLKALRTNLKLAIDYGLQRSQSDLVASYLQTLIMSEGDKWVRNSVESVSLCLQGGIEGKPVAAANNAVRSFATKEMTKAEGIAALEDYVANATFDLLAMAAWSLVLRICPNCKPIPTYYFARDDRVYKAFAERVHEHREIIFKAASKRLRSQLKVLGKVGEMSKTVTFRRKVEILAGDLD
ncbi:uncharacterized protein EI90DRAFT_2918273 [Cantharellus anzutake]|uniref:uncharacterized protein n=1 Tax=Cantharellus anzutake TaxID=1750568 RepID=UPI0019071886|nr:uncharacterized protein EI90DRAFT_2918273 [Cantharellus anzutake]KAF8332775.1 hypothetical protein EI90DRAFT_2918273 [Cantharellus anzutake]